MINYVTVGNTIPTEGRFLCGARRGDPGRLANGEVAMSVNRLCSSGLQGIVTTAQNILLGDCDYGIGGGVEVMSRGGYLSTAMRSARAWATPSCSTDGGHADRSLPRRRPHG